MIEEEINEKIGAVRLSSIDLYNEIISFHEGSHAYAWSENIHLVNYLLDCIKSRISSVLSDKYIYSYKDLFYSFEELSGLYGALIIPIKDDFHQHITGQLSELIGKMKDLINLHVEYMKVNGKEYKCT